MALIDSSAFFSFPEAIYLRNSLRILRAGEDKQQGLLFSYVRKVDERLAGRVISCFEE